MNDLVDLSQVDSDISEEEIIERAVIAAIELYADRLKSNSKGAKSTVNLSAEMDSKLNSAKDILKLTRQAMIDEALEYYFRWALYSKHINRSTLGII